MPWRIIIRTRQVLYLPPSRKVALAEHSIFKKSSIMKKEGYLVRFYNEGTVAVEEGQSLLDAALAKDIPLFYSCGGKARCSTCRVLVLQGAQALTPLQSKEQFLREEMGFPPDVRLACQTKSTGARRAHGGDGTCREPGRPSAECNQGS